MTEKILQLLKKVEEQYNVEILYACESGSRAWGFASPDSDYDIRFIYRHDREHYLSVFESPDTIEIPISEDLDPGGWDIRKALNLLGKSNGPLIELLHSPIVYLNKHSFRKSWQKLVQDIFEPNHLSNHYLGLAQQIRKKKLCSDEPSAKSYLYACRAALASKWIQKLEQPPPVPFSELLDIAEPDLKTKLEELVEWKSHEHETASSGRIAILDGFIAESLDVESSWTPSKKVDLVFIKQRLDEEFRAHLELSKPSHSISAPRILTSSEFSLDRLREKDLLLLDTLAGSHAYGTNTEHSDRDHRGLFVAPPSFLGSMEKLEQVSDEKSDEVYYELSRFFSLLEKNNPTALEILFTPEDCILYKHKAFDLIDPTIFLSKKCEQTFAGYAVAQIKKARGLNKKIINPQPEQRKHLRDFCYILDGQGSLSLDEWLKINSLQEEQCGLVAARHSPSIYGVYRSSSQQEMYRGIFSKKDDAALICSSVAKEAEPIAWMSCNIDAFKAHCREHREYWDWVNQRNENRYQTNASHGRGYDSKNMMHTIRLLDMAIEIAQQKILKVRRPNRDWLLQVKQGKFSYEYLLEVAEQRLEAVQQAFERCDLPEEPNRETIANLLHDTREAFHS